MPNEVYSTKHWSWTNEEVGMKPKLSVKFDPPCRQTLLKQHYHCGCNIMTLHGHRHNIFWTPCAHWGSSVIWWISIEINCSLTMPRKTCKCTLKGIPWLARSENMPIIQNYMSRYKSIDSLLPKFLKWTIWMNIMSQKGHYKDKKLRNDISNRYNMNTYNKKPWLNNNSHNIYTVFFSS